MEFERTTRNDGEQPLVVMINQDGNAAIKEPRPGDQCPSCGRGRLDYDGMLNLVCEACGFTFSGCFT